MYNPEQSEINQLFAMNRTKDALCVLVRFNTSESQSLDLIEMGISALQAMAFVCPPVCPSVKLVVHD